jgi:hypothetical protein
MPTSGAVTEVILLSLHQSDSSLVSFVALSLGVIVLKSHGQNTPDGGSIVLITDAKLDPNYPNRKSVFHMVSVGFKRNPVLFSDSGFLKS